MTEPIVECIRECSRPCRCDECTATDGKPLHPPTPVEASVGQLCQRDADRLWTALHEIGDLYGSLDWNIVETGPTEGGGGGKVTGSPAPFRLDAFALADPRTRYDKDDPQGPRYVPNVVGYWAAVASRQLKIAEPRADINSALWHLVAWWQQAVTYPWIGQAHDELVHVHLLLKRAHDDAPPRRNRIGRCTATFEPPAAPMQCGAALYATDGPVKCPACGHRYGPADLIALYLKNKATA